MNTLSAPEFLRYQTLKQNIKSWIDQRYAIGLALTEIQQKKLYRQDYETFEIFCQTEFKFDKSYAYRLIEYADVKSSPGGDKIQNEWQARELAKVPEAEREAVVSGLNKDTITSEKIHKAVVINKNLSPAGDKPPIELDKTGWPIPPSVVPLYARSPEAQELLLYITKIKSVLTKAQEIDDPLFREVNISGVLAHLSNAFCGLKCAVPFAVCPTCGAVHAETCTLCKGRGILSEFAWNSYVPEEIKLIRNKSLAKKL